MNMTDEAQEMIESLNSKFDITFVELVKSIAEIIAHENDDEILSAEHLKAAAQYLAECEFEEVDA